MLSNAYFLAKFRFDTAENEPAKNLQNLQIFQNLPFNPGSLPGPRASQGLRDEEAEANGPGLDVRLVEGLPGLVFGWG